MEVKQMADIKRKPLSKKIRFEVFKRDSFTCQYCGKKAPDVILHVDHIDPVAKGGTNNILNLVTSCEECNQGKRDVPLSDNSVLEKRRRQVEASNERREQFEMFFEWSKSLEEIDQRKQELVVNHIHDVIAPFSLNEKGMATIEKLVNKYTENEILDAVTIGKKYLKRNDNGVLDQDSVQLFLNKLGGIIFNTRKPPIEAKLSHIKGIGKNRFGFWDDAEGYILLNNYVKSLREQNYSEEQILKVLDEDIIAQIKTARNWPAWEDYISGLTQNVYSPISVNNQAAPSEDNEPTENNYSSPSSEEEIDFTAKLCATDTIMFIEFLKYIGAPFGEVDEEELISVLKKEIEKYLSDQLFALRGELIFEDGNTVDSIGIEDLSPDPTLSKGIANLLSSSEIDNGIKYYIEELILWKELPEWFDQFYFPSVGIEDEDGASRFIEVFEFSLEEELKKYRDK